MNRFKIGDKVEIPKTKSRGTSCNDFHKQLIDYNYDYLIIGEINIYHNIVSLIRADSKNLIYDSFILEDLVPYLEEVSLKDKILQITKSPLNYEQTQEFNKLKNTITTELLQEAEKSTSFVNISVNVGTDRKIIGEIKKWLEYEKILALFQKDNMNSNFYAYITIPS